MSKVDDHTALVLLDLQNEMVDPKGKIGKGGLAKVVDDRHVLENSASALIAARRLGLRVVHVRLGFRPDYLDALSVAPRISKLKQEQAAILGTFGTEFPECLQPSSGELVITKQCVNPFFNTSLMNWLHHDSINRLVLGGVVTNLVVEMTARVADDAGFEVLVMEDCCAAPSATWHQFAVENMLPMFASVTDSKSVFGI